MFAEGLRDLQPAWQVDGLLEDYASYARGEAAEVYPTVADVTGRPPLSIERFARDYVAAFAATPAEVRDAKRGPWRARRAQGA